MTDRIVIAGAGSIGCYVGGSLVLAGRDIVFLARPRIADHLAGQGLRVSDLAGGDSHIKPDRLTIETDPAESLAGAHIVLVSVKSGATAEMAALIDDHAPPHATIVSLQNGVENAERIRQVMTHRRSVLAGMVPFNVVLAEAAGEAVHVHRATAGEIHIETAPPGVARLLSCDRMPVTESADMRAVLWGKLLLNLNNALNALSDRPLVEQLSDRGWRKVLAMQMDEALAAMRGAGIRPAKLAGAPPQLLPTILRLPDWLFARIARRMLAIDPQARSSMWDDLVRRRPTEIDELQGAVLRLGASAGTATPVTRRVMDLIRAAEMENSGPPGLAPAAILR